MTFLMFLKVYFRKPTAKNPLMNVMLTDYKDDPNEKKPHLLIIKYNQ